MMYFIGVLYTILIAALTIIVMSARAIQKEARKEISDKEHSEKMASLTKGVEEAFARVHIARMNVDKSIAAYDAKYGRK